MTAPTEAEIIAAIEDAPTFKDGPGDYLANIYGHLESRFWNEEDFRKSETQAWSALMETRYHEFDALAHGFMRTRLTEAALQFATDHPNAARAERESVPA
jgi:hypothetical protein